MKLKHFIQWTILFSILTACGFAQTTAKVVKITDGDTYKLQVNGKIITARLANADAPEKTQNFGMAAKDSVNNLLLNKTVEIDSVGTDQYNRQITFIKIDNKRVDSILIVNGWAWHYKQYNSEAMLENCQTKAIANKKGLWACGVNGVCPPWVFRHHKTAYRLQHCNACKN